ncbi:uncharacterized protein FA14DRAFT_182007 [Meira miltonrushii]|uniref:Uncharacterized protein n=1 Tax=Meira miltonrushii TaxID=1280837 RepID=A0A316V7A7_9BASI|nr:uncharacterized protein FA14DRAFT_182007 [Meira miltonrushii]PWN32093.1 hypothetical protein FA14DRAFT_182007 [Meira miltonrushii]
MSSYTPTEEVMAAGPPVTISTLPGRSNGHSSADQYCSRSRSNSSAQSLSLSSRSHNQNNLALQQSPQGQQQTQTKEMIIERPHQNTAAPPRHQDSFDIHGWPEGIEKPTRFLGMKVKPISQWSIKHIFCLSY